MTVYNQIEIPFKTLSDVENWKEQELKNVVSLRRIMTDIDPKHVVKFKRWEDVLFVTYRHVQRFIESAARSNQELSSLLYDQVLELIEFCLKESVGFIRFCREIKSRSIAVQSIPDARETINQTIHQSDHFVGFAQVVLHQKG